MKDIKMLNRVRHTINFLINSSWVNTKIVCKYVAYIAAVGFNHYSIPKKAEYLHPFAKNLLTNIDDNI